MVHNIDALRVRFGGLLDELMDTYCLKNYLDEWDAESIDCSWTEQGEAVDQLGIWVATGATKFVIGTDDCDYVIKFQAPRASDFDYCAREVEVYNEAVLAGFADKFAWSSHLLDYTIDVAGEIITIPVYIMEWCQCSYDMIDDEMDDYHYTKFCTLNHKDKNDSYDEYANTYKYRGEYDERMMEWAYSVWGLDYNAPVAPEAGMTIAQFMRKMFINDLHAGNWGWCNNRLVLTDYSGYGDCYSCRSINY